MSSQFQLYTDNAGEFRWRLLADNNQTIATSSEGYNSLDSAQEAIQILQGGNVKTEVYEDAGGKFRFRCKANNGNILAVGEAYESKAACEHGVDLISKIGGTAPIVNKTTV